MGSGQGQCGCYHPEHQLLAVIYFCFKCGRIAGLQPTAQGDQAAAGRKGRWQGLGPHGPL